MLECVGGRTCVLTVRESTLTTRYVFVTFLQLTTGTDMYLLMVVSSLVKHHSLSRAHSRVYLYLSCLCCLDSLAGGLARSDFHPTPSTNYNVASGLSIIDQCVVQGYT